MWASHSKDIFNTTIQERNKQYKFNVHILSSQIYLADIAPCTYLNLSLIMN